MISNAVKELQSSKHQLLAQIKGLEQEINQIDQAVAALAGLDGSDVAAPTPAPAAVQQGTMSSAHRQALALAQKARWAKVKLQKSAPVSAGVASPAKKRKKMSPLGKLKIKLGSLNRYGKTAEAKKVRAQIAALQAQ